MVLYKVAIGKTMEEFTLKLLFTFKKIAFTSIVDFSNLSSPKMEHKKEKFQESFFISTFKHQWVM